MRKKDKKDGGQRGLGLVCLVLLLFPGLVSGTVSWEKSSAQ